MKRCGWAATLALACAIAPGATAWAADAPAGNGIRTVILVRHGVYDEDDARDPAVGRALTETGRTMARLTAARLAHLGVRVDAIHASPLTRARQTAQILADSLGLAPVLSDDLRECTPPTERPEVMARYRAGAVDSCRAALERDWARYFGTSPGRDSVEVIVCHGNVIRWLVARALGLAETRWLNLTIANCSLSVVQIHPDGRMRLASFDDTGHLPPALVSYPAPAWDPGLPPKKR